jgi:hypothetical protein
MDLPVIKVTGDEAAAKLAEYEAAGGRTALDEAVIRAYRAVRGGAQVIRLSEAVRAGGFDGRGMPRLAVAGAEWQEVTCRWSGDDLVFTDSPGRQNRGAAVGRHTVRVSLPAGARPAEANMWRSGQAVVPLVPPRCRPRRGRLSRCHVLWEAEWDMTVPRDPALIRRVAGDLWTVLSVWDLTELERAVLAQR